MSKFIPFPMFYDDVPLDISFALEQDIPAGKRGFLKCDGDVFRFEDGTPARFWGVNINGGANFPEHDYAEKVARRLAQAGCNIARFHQLDAEWDTPNMYALTKGKRVTTTRVLDEIRRQMTIQTIGHDKVNQLRHVRFFGDIHGMIDHMSNIKLREFLRIEKPAQEMIPVIEQTVRACEVMSRERVGALLVFARHNSLEEYFKTGTLIDGQVSEQLIRNVFFPKASLHDGAVIIRDGRVMVAGCVLPLSESNRISADLGTRHRAALGMSEVSDAVVVVVSEETGAISVAVGGMLKRHLAPQTLERLLCNELCPKQEGPEENLVVKLRQKLQKKDKEEKKHEK